MSTLLRDWEILINTTISPTNGQLRSLSEESIHNFIYQSVVEREKTRALLIEGVVDKPKIRDKQHYIQLHHAMLIRLLDQLHTYKQMEGLSDITFYLYNTITQHLEYVLRFIEDYFSNYLDRNEKVPTAYLIISIDEINRHLELLQQKLKTEGIIETSLINILINSFTEFCKRKENGTSYNEIIYQKELLNELLQNGTLASEMNIREVLVYFNFNDADYIAYLYEKLNALTEPLYTKKEKIAALRFEQKTLNQLTTKPNYHLSASMPSLKEQVNHWIEEEVKFLEAAQTPETSQKTDGDSDGKIHTSLSVARFALLLRLMVIDKIIINRVVANVLRIAVRMVTTLQKENIAFGSLETKYHNPDRGTISAVKDMLFRWVNILNKL